MMEPIVSPPAPAAKQLAAPRNNWPPPETIRPLLEAIFLFPRNRRETPFLPTDVRRLIDELLPTDGG